MNMNMAGVGGMPNLSHMSNLYNNIYSNNSTPNTMLNPVINTNLLQTPDKKEILQNKKKKEETESKTSTGSMLNYIYGGQLSK